ncbi:hypothetical protein D3C76_1711950 [compost metagenome]
MMDFFLIMIEAVGIKPPPPEMAMSRVVFVFSGRCDESLCSFVFSFIVIAE